MRIQNNITADNAHRQIGINTRNVSLNAEKLSSGFRVNRAADDAAGLAISEKMRTQIRGLNRASLNIQDGVSLLQVGDGGLQSIHDKMQRMRELAVQSANGTNASLDREAIQLEFGQLTAEINDLVSRLSFNDRVIFDGSIGASWEYVLGKITVPYTTTIPAADDFASPHVDVPGWGIPTAFGRMVTTQNLADSSYIWPTSGVFAMQIVTPAYGTINVILDFEQADLSGTPIDSLDKFLNYFKTGFNSFPGIGTVVEDIVYDANLTRFEFVFPTSGTTLAGVLGERPASHPATPADERPRVVIGLGTGLASDGTANSRRDSLNGIPTGWAAAPFSTYSNHNATITADTEFANLAILGNDGVVGIAQVATPPAAGFGSITLTVEGRPTTINLTPGRYETPQAFVDAHRTAFANAGFDLSVGDDGKLVITTKTYGGNATPAVTINITPNTAPNDLAAALGFGSSPTITTERDISEALWIQSGANAGDGILIETPPLDTRALGLSIMRPLDEAPPEGVEHTNILGADGYVTTPNVPSDPAQYSLDVTTHHKASAALSVLDNAINIISTERARIGAQQNRLEFAKANVDNTSENLGAAESRIRDTDMAGEMTTFVKNQILMQSSTAMLAQANTLPQGVLQLLG